MRRFGVNKKNPNPPWPSEQPVVAVPAGVSASAVGRHGENVRSMPVDQNQEPKITVEDREIIADRGTMANAQTMANAETMEENRLLSNDNNMRDNNSMSVEELEKEPFVMEDRANTNPYIGMNVPLNNENAFNDRERPIMGYIPETSMRSSDARRGQMGGISPNQCETMMVGGYLCGQRGNLVRVEFLFGENTHIEKTGVLKNVGKDFIVLSETGTNNSIVCSMRNIKFINIYNINGGMR